MYRASHKSPWEILKEERGLKHEQYVRNLVFLVSDKEINFQHSEIIRLHTDRLRNSMCLAYTKLPVQ